MQIFFSPGCEQPLRDNYVLLLISITYICSFSDVFGWPQPQCQFPDWLIRHTWQDLANSHLFIPDPAGNSSTFVGFNLSSHILCSARLAQLTLISIVNITQHSF